MIAILMVCGLLATALTGAPDTDPTSLLRLPPSHHVTGHYPAHCTAAARPGGASLPDRACTPGSVSTVDAARVCEPGYAGRMRPPTSETGPLKRVSMRAYGLEQSRSSTTELDHLVSLQLGGTSDVTNTWPEVSDIPGSGFRNRKDVTENRLHFAVCSRRVSLIAAQEAIASDWTTAERKLGLSG